MKGTRTLNVAILLSVLMIALAGCVERDDAGDDTGTGDRSVPTPEETTTPEPDPTPGDDSPDAGDWYELIESDKTYPEEEHGEQVLELAEREDEFLELWEWFELDSAQDAPELDWDAQLVLFAGIGESSGCPLVLEDVSFDEDERFISVAATRDVSEDTMCTMDWTPRVFVIALDAETLGEGELRAGIYDTDAIDGISPDDGEVVRE